MDTRNQLRLRAYAPAAAIIVFLLLLVLLSRHPGGLDAPRPGFPAAPGTSAPISAASGAGRPEESLPRPEAPGAARPAARDPGARTDAPSGEVASGSILLVGRLVAADTGAPPPQAHVRLVMLYRDHTNTQHPDLDADGRFGYTMFPLPEKISLEASASGGYLGARYLGWWDGGERWAVGDVMLVRGAEIAGQVVTDTGGPLPHVTVTGAPQGVDLDWWPTFAEADRPTSGRWESPAPEERRVETDARGRFRLGPLDPSHLHVLAVMMTGGPSEPPVATVAGVAAPEDGIRIEVRDLARIRVRVVGEARPAGWRLRVLHGGNAGVGFLHTTWCSGEEGVVSVRPGTMKLDVATERGAAPLGIEDLILGPGEEKIVEWNPSALVGRLPATIRFSVPPGFLEPTLAHILAPPPANPERELYGVHVSKGVGRIGEVPPGRHTIIVSFDDDGDRVLRLDVDVPEDAREAVAEPRIVRLATLKLINPGGATVRVRIRRVDRCGRFIFWKGDGWAMDDGQSWFGVPARGEFPLDRLLPGDYEVGSDSGSHEEPRQWRRITLGEAQAAEYACE